ncbi:MAG: rhomboid family intramembrane serine protease [Myxococcales bacterium]|nr:rhomboid family intramembrane serine protease [Myxococcales bacterium]
MRVRYNAPVVLTFALAAAVVQLLPESIQRYFAAWPEFYDWRSYLGLFSHILGHAGWDHLLANFSIILIIGPILEERHGSASLLGMILITALITGLINVAFTNQYLVGASGIAFMMVVLASVANIKAGEIPLTFIAVAVLFMGREVVGAFKDDQVSQAAHLIGGTIGGAFGFLGAGRGGARPPALAAGAPPRSPGPGPGPGPKLPKLPG